MINNWDKKVVNKLEKYWDKNISPWSTATFKLASSLGARFLDLGCGTCRFLKYLQDNYYLLDFEYTGIDSSLEMINLVREKFPRLSITKNFICEDILNLEINRYKPLQYDVVLCNEVFLHLLEKDQKKVLENINKLDVENNVVTIQTSIRDDLVPTTNFTSKVELCNLEGQKFINNIQDLDKFEKTICSVFGGGIKINHFTFAMAKNANSTTLLITRI